MSSLYIRQIHNLNVLQHFCPNFPPHLHQNLELLFILKGSGDAYCDGEHYYLEPGDLFISYPNQVHYFANFPDEGRSFAFMIPPKYLEEFRYLIDGKCPLSAKVRPKNKGQFAALMKMAWDISKKSTGDNLLKCYATTVFRTAIDFCPLRDSAPTNDTVSQILDYCTSHFRENITVTSISEKFFVSRSTISRIFSNKISMSFNDYINSLRISEFLCIMQKRQHSITEAAALSGFSTIRTFNGAFKKQYGVTPTKYLEKIRI